MQRFKKHLFVLIDFKGHPQLSNDANNKKRYNNFISLYNLQSPSFLKKKFIVINNTPLSEDQGLTDIKNNIVSKGVNWIDVDSFSNINDVLDKIKVKNESTQIYIAGTNTSGCCYASKKLGAYYWAKQGFNVEINLKYCYDNFSTGETDSDKQLSSVCVLYKNIYNHQLNDKIKITNEIRILENE